MARAGSVARPVSSLIDTARLAPTPTRKERREMEHRLLVVQADGLETAARVHTAGIITRLSLHEVGQITDQQLQELQRAPLGAARYQLVADNGAVVVSEQLVALGERWRRPW